MEVNLKELVAGFERNHKALAQELFKLEEQAQDVRGQLEARDAARAKIATAQREIAALKGERSDLQTSYMTASFEGDEEAMKEVQDRRASLDDRLEELENLVHAERDSMQPADSQHAASVAVQRDMLKPINVANFIEQLTELLQADVGEINQRISKINVPESAYSREDYQRIRAGKDSSYASFLAREKRLAVKDKERLAKMQPVSSTDEMHSIQSGNRKPSEDRMKWISKGEKVRGYSERRVSNDEADDRTHVLSGDEVRAALAAKT